MGAIPDGNLEDSLGSHKPQSLKRVVFDGITNDNETTSKTRKTYKENYFGRR